MVIRVSKPEINLRDKLSQLELPVGPYGSSLMRADDIMEAARIVGVGRKNTLNRCFKPYLDSHNLKNFYLLEADINFDIEKISLKISYFLETHAGQFDQN